MNPPGLIKLAKEIGLESNECFSLRVTFGVACIERVEHLIINSDVHKSLLIGKAFVAGTCDHTKLGKAAKTASEKARSHSGTNSLDGTGSAAVTTSLGVAAALEGKALQAAGYAAYASVYSYASYAVTDPSAYASEHAWQIDMLKQLSRKRQS